MSDIDLRAGPGRGTVVLQEATAVAGWLLPEWRIVHKILEDRASKAESMES